MRRRRPHSRPTGDARPIDEIVPVEERRAYDMHKVIDALVDADSFFELKPLWARELLIGFARIDGIAVGVVANNPSISGECCSAIRPTKPRASSGCATRSTCRSCSSPTCPAS